MYRARNCRLRECKASIENGAFGVGRIAFADVHAGACAQTEVGSLGQNERCAADGAAGAVEGCHESALASTYDPAMQPDDVGVTVGGDGRFSADREHRCEHVFA